MGDNDQKNSETPRSLRLLVDVSDQQDVVKSTELAAADLAKFALDVIALNRQAGSSPQSASDRGPVCKVASLESLQRGLKIRSTPEKSAAPAQVTLLRPPNKE